MVRLVDVVMVCIPCSMGMGVAVAMGVPMGMRVILPGIPPQE
jgi:ATP-dependent protease ClpP protease subunit